MLKQILPLLSLAALPASAAFLYEFTGSRTSNQPGSFSGATFTLTVALPILEDAYFEPGPQLSCNQCGSVSFFVDGVALWLTSTPSQVVSYQIANSIGYNFFFPPATFETPGTFESIVLAGIHDGVLEAREVEPEPAPEPATLALLAAGLGLAIGASRPKR